MSKEFEKLMCFHEESDKDYIHDINEIKARIAEEFENADEFLTYLKADEKAAKAFFDYSGTKPYLFDVIPVRKSDRLYVKKHTATQRPYYHTHLFYEIIFVAAGKCSYFVYPGGEKTTLEKGSVCLLAPGAVHAIGRAGKKDVVLKAVVQREIFEDIFKDVFAVSYGSIMNFDSIGDRAQAYFQNFTRENSQQEKFSRVMEKAWLTLFLAELFAVKKEKVGDIVEKFSCYIKGNLKTASLAGFAKSVGYNPDYLSRVIKRVTGKSFKESVTDVRLRTAKELLKTTDMSVESVSAETGYQNASGFYKQFTATFGITPAQYRESQR